VWYALYFALAFGAYAVGALMARPTRKRLARFAAAAVGLLVVTGPYLVLRAREAYGPQNPIHTDPQGLLYFSPRLYTVDPQAIWGWNGPWLVVALLAVPWLWSRRRAWSGAVYLATVTPAVLLIVLNPLLLPLLQPRLGYLTMRLIWIAPVIPAVATVVTALCEAVVRGKGGPRARAALALGALLLLLAPRLSEGVDLVAHHAREHGLLVGVVVDDEVALEADFLRVATQQLGAHGVERAHP